MMFFKILIGLPIIVALLIFAFVNNNMVEISFWPTDIEATISLSVLIVILYAIGYIAGWFFSWLSYAPIRRALRNQKKQNRKMSKEQEKLNKEVEDLRGNINIIKSASAPKEKNGLFKIIKSLFKSKSSQDVSED